MTSKYKLVPIEPTPAMCVTGFLVSEAEHDPAGVYKAMLDAAPEVERVGFCEDTALSLAERTFSSEVDEQLAEDVIQYARRLYDMYTTPQPAPEIAKLVEALEQGFPLLSDEGLDEVEHHCEWAIQRERKRVHSILTTLRQQGGDV